MTRLEHDTAFGALVEEVLENGVEGLAHAVSILFNEAMKVERSRALAAQPYERTPERNGYANGFKPKTLNTRMGKLFLSVPQTRGGKEPFYPSVIEKGLRSERALKSAMAEMYIHGVSTRKVAKVLQDLCGLDVSSTEVSRCNSLLDEEIKQWQNRPLGAIRFLLLDATYVKVRSGGVVQSCAVLIAAGITPEGTRTVLGSSVAQSEAGIHWKTFLSSLVRRGLTGVEMITSDRHAGLVEACCSVFSGAMWNRCHVHVQRDAAKYVPRTAWRAQVAEDIRQIYLAQDVRKAQTRLNEAVAYWEKKAPKLSEWMEENVPEGFSVMKFPVCSRKRLHTSNLVERMNKEVKRRTRVVSVFPNVESAYRLVAALCMEISQDWEGGRIYLKLQDDIQSSESEFTE